MRFMSERGTHAILVVDDCPGLGAALAALFTCEGFRVHSASNGLEALDVLDREDVELVLSDVNMPDCDGFELLTRVKTRRAEGPVVLLHTGNTSVDLERGFLLGAEAVYFKPVEADTLVSAIHSYLPPPGARAAPICQACGESGHRAPRRRLRRRGALHNAGSWRHVRGVLQPTHRCNPGRIHVGRRGAKSDDARDRRRRVDRTRWLRHRVHSTISRVRGRRREDHQPTTEFRRPVCLRGHPAGSVPREARTPATTPFAGHRGQVFKSVGYRTARSLTAGGTSCQRRASARMNDPARNGVRRHMTHRIWMIASLVGTLALAATVT